MRQIQRLLRRLLLGAAITVLTLGALPRAEATLTYDLRLVGGGTEYQNVAVGQQITLELYAVVTGSPGNVALEGFQSGLISILSSNGGNVKGNLSAVLAPTFAATGAQTGTASDLDSDGDLDLGTNGANNADHGFLYARSSTMQMIGTAIADGQEFKLATITFTVTSVVSLTNDTPISLFVRVPDFTSALDGPEAVWQQDGVTSNNVLGAGQPFPNGLPGVGTAVQVHAVPEPAAAALLPLATLFLARRRRRTSRTGG